MSASIAHEYARRMVSRECRGPGDIERALERLEARYGISRWQMSHLRKGNAKTIETGLFHRLKSAFIDHCGKQAARLLHEAEMARQVGEDSDDVAAIEDQIRTLAARLEIAKGKAKGTKG